MSLPKLLIIGAMKAGTTSLYMDLATHPGVFLAQDKEPESLCSDAVLAAEGRAAYEAIYRRAQPEQLCCDASTAYAKLPDYPGVPERAIQTLPEGFKAIYLVRHPIERIISQHHHEFTAGLVGSSIDEEVRRHARYIHYSRYSFQIQPWLDALGRDRIRVIQFEDYVNRRGEVLAELAGFLGLDPSGFTPRVDKVYNKSQGKPVKTSFWGLVQQNSFYRNYLRLLIPLKSRLAVRRVLLPKAPDRLAPPSRETRELLRQSLRDDVLRLSELVGRQEPFWADFGGDSSNLDAGGADAT